jgi:hypothetical protein
MSPVPVFSFEQNKARKVALSTMGFVWHINSSTMHMIRLILSGTSTLISYRTRTSRDISSNLLQKILFLLKMQRPVSITRELPRGGGLDFNSQNKHEHKKRHKHLIMKYLQLNLFYLKLKKREFLQ